MGNSHKKVIINPIKNGTTARAQGQENWGTAQAQGQTSLAYMHGKKQTRPTGTVAGDTGDKHGHKTTANRHIVDVLDDPLGADTANRHGRRRYSLQAYP